MYYNRLLRRIVHGVFDDLTGRGMTLPRIATRAGLAYETVRRLRVFKTMRPQLRTVALLAHAAGMTLALVPSGK